MCFRNRRVRNRSHGGVRGRGPQGPLLLDLVTQLLLNTKEHSKDYIFVILSAAKNLSFEGAEIRNEAALRSE
jgi:hypothetical protein